jgi:hypothetical protein
MPELAQSQRPRRVRLEWLLPPLLALAAIGFHFVVDVPHHPMLLREDDEPEEQKTTTAARTPRPFRARGAAYIERLRKSWSTKPIDAEPIEPRFAEHHEDLLRALLRKAEAAVMPIDEPLLVSVRATCHTIRCELEFCAPSELAEAIVERLPGCTIRGRALWHELREVETETEPDDGETCHRYLVDFAVEGADARHLKL